MAEALSILFADRDLAWSRKDRVDLRARGARVSEAGDAEGALKQTAAVRPDLIVLDDDLVGKSDRDLVELLREKQPFVEIILLESRPANAPHGIGRGLLYSGTKPLQESTLLSLIEEAFPGRLHEPTPA